VKPRCTLFQFDRACFQRGKRAHSSVTNNTVSNAGTVNRNKRSLIVASGCL